MHSILLVSLTFQACHQGSGDARGEEEQALVVVYLPALTGKVKVHSATCSTGTTHASSIMKPAVNHDGCLGHQGASVGAPTAESTTPLFVPSLP